MRALFGAMLLLAACGHGPAASSPSDRAPDAGKVADAGFAAAPDGGDVADAGVAAAPDAGPEDSHVATIAATPCPASPPLLWSRTTSLDADFRGATDTYGNMYWTEYDVAPTSQGWLVSVDSSGRERYRVQAAAASPRGAFLIASGRVVMSKGALLEGYNAATGTLAWSFDLGTMDPAYSRTAGLGSIADTGSGAVAFIALGQTTYGVYTLDVATGTIVSSRGQVGWVAAADGAGGVLTRAGAIGIPYPAEDLYMFDRQGSQVWSAPVHDGTRWDLLFAWPAGPPLVRVAGITSMERRDRYMAVPEEWIHGVMGNDLGFAVDLTVHAIPGGSDRGWRDPRFDAVATDVRLTVPRRRASRAADPVRS